MSMKLFSAMLFTAVLIASGMALADPPNLCPGEEFTTPGEFNQVENEEHGTPGNQTGADGEPILPADMFARERNEARFTEDCPPPQGNPH
jgi:hypothetical protein